MLGNTNPKKKSLIRKSKFVENKWLNYRPGSFPARFNELTCIIYDQNDML